MGVNFQSAASGYIELFIETHVTVQLKSVFLYSELVYWPLGHVHVKVDCERL